jgi:hypothetical protein
MDHVSPGIAEDGQGLGGMCQADNHAALGRMRTEGDLQGGAVGEHRKDAIRRKRGIRKTLWAERPSTTSMERAKSGVFDRENRSHEGLRSDSGENVVPG